MQEGSLIERQLRLAHQLLLELQVAMENFNEWIEPMLASVHRQGYRAPNIRRVYIPKPGKTEKRPLGAERNGNTTRRFDQRAAE